MHKVSASTACGIVSNCIRPDELRSAVVRRGYMRKLIQESGSEHTFRSEKLDTDWLVVGTVFVEDVHNVLLGYAVGSVEKMQNTGRMEDSILGCRLGICKAIVTIAHEIFEGTCSVGQVEWLLDIVQKGLLGEAKLHFNTKKGDLVQRGNASFHRTGIAHLHHRTAFFAFQKLDLK